MGGPTGWRPEVLFLINFTFDLLFLWFAASISWARPKWWRLLLASGLGAALPVLPVITPGAAWLISGPAVLLLSIALVLLVVWPCTWVQFGAVFGGFWLSLALAGGGVMLLEERYGPAGSGLPLILVGSGVGLALVGIQLSWQSYRERKPVRDALCFLRVQVGGGEQILTALVDSGNSLRTLGRRPIAVVEAEPLRRLLPPEVMEAISMGWEGLATLPDGWLQRCQLIPFAALGSPQGSLLVLQPEALAVRTQSQGAWVEVSGAIGLTLQVLHPQGQYQALLAPEMLIEAESR